MGKVVFQIELLQLHYTQMSLVGHCQLIAMNTNVCLVSFADVMLQLVSQQSVLCPLPRPPRMVDCQTYGKSCRIVQMQCWVKFVTQIPKDPFASGEPDSSTSNHHETWTAGFFTREIRLCYLPRRTYGGYVSYPNYKDMGFVVPRQFWHPPCSIVCTYCI